MDYEVVKSLELQKEIKTQPLPLVILISTTKINLWNVRQSVINNTTEWTVFGVTKCIELEVKKICSFEAQKCKWKGLFLKDPKYIA